MMTCGHLELDPAEEQVLRTLTKWQVRFVVIGGHAVRFHGRDRLVNDLDLVIERSEDNAQRLINAVAELGVGGAGMTVVGLTQPKMKARLPRYDVDVLTSIDAVSWEDLFRERRVAFHQGLEVPICSLLHLLRMKRASDRPEDRRDYEALLACHDGG